MRFALDRFIEQGPSAAAATFTAAVEQTVRDANRFKQALASGDFELAYQPIVQLRGDGGLHHFEALARFDRDASPADSIQLAEELGLIVEFDLEVVRMVAKALTAAPLEVRIAANLSAASLLADGFVDGVLAITASKPRLRGRLLLEITETQALKDLAAANAAIGRLRGAGHLICLDDYGAGAASLNYLRSLDVDFVKIDGRYVQRLVAGSRDATILKHLAALCRELGVTTIAEMIETPEVEAVARDLGVDLGQGWQFAKPLAQPIWPPASPAVAARRQGVVEGWG
jgi:EAL domain-containing protein (putative c-di-GMP-specific phosphodiesterase class I)